MQKPQIQSTLSPNSFSRSSLKAAQKGYLVKPGSSINKKFLIYQTQYPGTWKRAVCLVDSANIY